jgi:tetratricopeptide (TPR) repeat protein
MKKKQIRKSSVPIKKSNQKPIIENIEGLRSKKMQTYLGLIIAIFAFLLYAQTLSHEYTLDDHNVVDKNRVTTMGIAGIPTILKTDYWYGSGKDDLRGPIYRPTSLIVYALIWEISPNNPHTYHLINVILYALTGFVLFILLCKIFNTYNEIVPFLCTFLYIAHPLHTEVVNNIKSLDEILCFLFAVCSILFLWKFIYTKSKISFLLGGLFYFLTLTSKETGIAFLVIIPLIIYFFSDCFKKKIIIPISILLVIITTFWLVLRAIVFTDLHQNIITQTSALNNTLYAAPNISSKYATAFYILIRYVGLLIFPHPLTCDYNYAQIEIKTFNDPLALIGFLFYFMIFCFSIFYFKKRSIISFGILFYLISLSPVSNIFFLGGSSMAERFMYIPSFGFCIIFTYFLLKLFSPDALRNGSKSVLNFHSKNKAIVFVISGVVILYSIKIFDRNQDWKNTLTIYSHDIHISKNSATANELLGNSLVLQTAYISNKKDKADTFNLAKVYLKKAIEIAPAFYNASSNLGYIYLVENKPDSAFLYLSQGKKYGPDDEELNYYLGSSLFLLKKFDDAVNVLKHTVSLNPNNETAYSMLASSYLSKGEVENAMLYFNKVIELNPQSAVAYYNLAQIYKARGDIEKSKQYIDKAILLGYKLK